MPFHKTIHLSTDICLTYDILFTWMTGHVAKISFKIGEASWTSSKHGFRKLELTDEIQKLIPGATNAKILSSILTDLETTTHSLRQISQKARPFQEILCYKNGLAF